MIYFWEKLGYTKFRVKRNGRKDMNAQRRSEKELDEECIDTEGGMRGAMI